MTEFEIQVLMRDPKVVEAFRFFRYMPFNPLDPDIEAEKTQWVKIVNLCKDDSDAATRIWKLLWEEDWLRSFWNAD